MMTFREQRSAFAKILNNHYSQEEISSFFYLLTEHYFGYSRFETHQKSEKEIPIKEEHHFSEALKRLEQHEPIQYIIGETEFYGLPFKVNAYTLIPRPETEELVAWIVSDLSVKNSEFRILDIGTGSGCIAISVAKELAGAKVSAIDISEGAIKTAQVNAEMNNVNVAFKTGDILRTEKLSTQYDVIVSNPPYVRNLEKKMMQANVLDFEPETALFVEDNDPFLFYNKISQLAINHLNKNGFLYFEINEYLGPKMQELLKGFGFKNIEIKKDIYGKDRMMRVIR